MATLVLSTVGTIVAGPIGGMVGALVGQQIDQVIFAPKGRKGPRLGDLSVQTSSYGSPIPKVFGTMRVAGTVIWATDLKEDRHKAGGGKGRPKTTTYSYSASFAVALSGRRIAGVGRIWADGKLLRGAAGDFKTETRYRVHVGAEDQTADPLIAAAEGIASTPAFRGTAYAVFENFQLGDYGNRIPSLTFEVIADEEGTATGTIVEVLSRGSVAAGEGQRLTGFAAHGDSVRSVVAALADAVPHPLFDDGTRLRMGRSEEPVATVDAGLAQSGAGEASRRAAGQVPAGVEVGYYDPERDYQAGLQRSSHRAGGGNRAVEQIALAAACHAGTAKAIAAAKLDHHWRTRERRVLVMPWSEIGVRPGRLVRLGADGGPPATGKTWLVSGWTLERMTVRLELVADGGAQRAVPDAVSGRAATAADLVHGPTTLHAFDAPSLGEPGTEPRLLVAAAGASAGWRIAALEASSDAGASWRAAGATAPPAVIGRALGRLEPGESTLFDERGSVEIELLNEAMWLESRDRDALATGANLAMLGSELIQFGNAVAVGPRRFRLSHLLRGRRGTEWAAEGHQAGDAFTLIEPESLAAIAVPLASVGGTAEIAARGIGDGDAPVIAAAAAGLESVRPPAPVHLRASRSGDGVLELCWVRRSRAGWAWIDGVDAPLGEAAEAYRVTVTGGARGRTSETAAPEWVYGPDAQAEDGVVPGTPLTIEVVQIGTLAPSRAARIEIRV